MTTDTAPPLEAAPELPADRKPRMAWARGPVFLSAASLIVGLAAGSGIGLAAAGHGNATELNAAQTGQQMAEIDRDAALTQVQRWQRTAKSAQADAATAYSSKLADVASREAAVKAREDTVTTRENAVAGKETAAKASEIPGDGAFIVGVDVKVGTYKSAGPSGSNCYWERTSDLAGQNIVANDNTSGPAILEVRPTDKMVKTDGCQPFEKVG